MKITYDKEANAAYIYIRKFQKVSRTVPVTNDVIIDFSARGIKSSSNGVKRLKIRLF